MDWNPPEEMPHALTPGRIKSFFDEEYKFGYQFKTLEDIQSMWVERVSPTVLTNEQVEIRACAQYEDAVAAMEEHTFE